MNRTLAFCLVILAAAAAITAVIFTTEPTAERSGATRETAMLVNVIEVERGTYRPSIVAMGTVEPAQDITLSPRVAGQIVERDESFVPGGFVRQGQRLLQIDPADFENALHRRRAEQRQAVADLQIEQGRQDVARQEYQLLGDELKLDNESLVLRQPQLDAAQSRVESARAAVEQAELDLERTTIRAPFDAHVLTRNANVGSQVAPGDDLGRLVGRDHYWVAATLPLSKLPWIRFPDQAGQIGSRVRIRNSGTWDQGQHREGRLFRLVGTLEDRTRMARLLLTVPDPMGHEVEGASVPPLVIGAFVEARIRGEPIDNVVRLDRSYVRQDDTVWVMADGQLDIRKARIPFRDAQYAYVDSGLDTGDRVVTTNLATVTEGAALRLPDAPEADTSVLEDNPAGPQAR